MEEVARYECVYNRNSKNFKDKNVLNVLGNDFGIIGSAHKWFSSYLTGRKQRVLINDRTSDDFHLNCGVPQGSCMGPILFILYIYYIT